MNTILATKYFETWLAELRDNNARMKIIRRIERAEAGNFGDHKNVGGPIWEMRIDYGLGYRLYYGQTGKTIYLLVCGGNKSTQERDIALAGEIWRRING